MHGDGQEDATAISKQVSHTTQSKGSFNAAA